MATAVGSFVAIGGNIGAKLGGEGRGCTLFVAGFLSRAKARHGENLFGPRVLWFIRAHAENVADLRGRSLMAHGAKSIDPTFSAKSRPTWDVVRRVAVYLRPYKLLAGTTILCAVLSLLSSFAFPKLTAYAIDEVIRKARPQLLTPVMLGLIGAFLLRDLFNAFRILVNNHFEQNVIFDMRRDVYGRLQRL